MLKFPIILMSLSLAFALPDAYSAGQTKNSDKNKTTQRKNSTNKNSQGKSTDKSRQSYPKKTSQPKKSNTKTLVKRKTSTAVRSKLPRSSHDTHYDKRTVQTKKDNRYRYHETYRYNTFYLAPIQRHFHPINFRLKVLPQFYVSLSVLGSPYFYFDGIYYQSYLDGYIVVRAPIGAAVRVLPTGFIGFHHNGLTYYYINHSYYLWNTTSLRYVVVEKPDGADDAVTDTTQGRLYVYPNAEQSEQLQAKDRYECHLWAVEQTDVDPMITESEDLPSGSAEKYKRALTACLTGRDYTVK